MLGRSNLDCSEFTIIWKSSLEKFRAVWSTEGGEENYVDETIINALMEILHLMNHILGWKKALKCDQLRIVSFYYPSSA